MSLPAFQALDGNGVIIYVDAASGAGSVGSPYVPGSCPIDGVHAMSTLFDLDSSGSTHEYNLCVGLRISASGGSIEAKGQQLMANSVPVVVAINQSTLPISGTVTANAGTNLNTSALALEAGGNLAAAKADLDTLAGAVSGAKFQVTVASALPAGTNVIGHVIADTGSTTAVTGNVTVVQATGTNLHAVLDAGTAVIGHVIVDSGTITTVSAVTAITNALPAGTNVIGHVIADTGSTTAVTGNVTVVQATGTNLHVVIDANTAVIGHVIVDSGTITTVTTVTTVSTVTAVTAITNALPAGTNTLGQVALVPITSGGLDHPYSFLSTAAVQAANIKASAGQIYAMEFFNISATPVYVRLYDETTNPPVTTDVPIARFAVPGNTAASGFVKEWPTGIEFITGIGIRVTAGIADNDATALAANTVIGNVWYE